MKIFLAAAIAASVLLSQGAAFADGNTATVRGYIKDAAGKPLPGAMVMVVNQEDTIKLTTDKNGFFSANSIRPGKAAIKISKAGHESVCRNPLIFAANQTYDFGSTKLPAGKMDGPCYAMSNIVKPGVTADVYDIF